VYKQIVQEQAESLAEQSYRVLQLIWIVLLRRKVEPSKPMRFVDSLFGVDQNKHHFATRSQINWLRKLSVLGGSDLA
jgi:hypothetical protein